MRSISFFLVVTALILSGCDSVKNVPDHLRERITGADYVTRVFPADQRTTFEAARAALSQLNFRYVRGGAAQGRIEALGALQSGDRLRDSHQLSLQVKMSPAIDGGTEISALFSESYQDEFSQKQGLGDTAPLHDTGLYEVYFRYIDEALKKPKS